MRLAQAEIAKQDGWVSSAAATVWPGTVRQHHFADTCTSGLVLEVDLVGSLWLSKSTPNFLVPASVGLSVTT